MIFDKTLYVIKTENFQYTVTNKKPEDGYYPENIVIYNNDEYLIKSPNYHWFYNNEVYYLAVLNRILEDKNSTKCMLLTDNSKPDNDKDKYKILSKIVPDTKNISQFFNTRDFDRRYQQPAKNFISSIFATIVIGSGTDNANNNPSINVNVDPNSTNILVDNNNKFYLIDPLVISQNNKFGINALAIQKKIDGIYNNFIKTANHKNIKQPILELFTKYFQICNDDFLTNVKKFLENLINDKDCQTKYSQDNIDKTKKLIAKLENVISQNEKLIDHLLPKVINSMRNEDIVAEISLVKSANNEQFKEDVKKMTEFFESKENFPGFGESGLQIGFGARVINRIEGLKNLKLSEMKYELKVLKLQYQQKTQ